MVSVTNTQNTAAPQPPQNPNQISMEKVLARVAAMKERLDARNSAVGTGASPSVRPATTSDADSRAMAKLASFMLEHKGELIWTRASGFTEKFANRPSTPAAPSTPAPTFGTTEADNVGKGGELIVSNKGDKISGGAGNDIIVAGAGSVIHGGDGNDNIRSAGQLYGDKGNDRIEGGGTLYGGEGDDTITLTYRASEAAYSGAAKAYGGAGNDRIDVRGGNVFTGYGDATAEGGTGDDFIQISGNARSRAAGENTTVIFNVGDGRDYVQARHADVVLELGEGFTIENMKISYSEDGGTAFITFDGNEDDQLEIKNMDHISTEAASTFTIKFTDGTMHMLEELKSRRDVMFERFSAYFEEFS